MGQKLALVHTSQVFINVETMMKDLFKEIMPEVQLINIVDDSLLPDVMAEGQIPDAVMQRMCGYFQAAEVAGADAVLSLCSTVGPVVDAARALVDIPIIKIDDAHTERAVRDAENIGVLATVATTLHPTIDLIRRKAAELGKEVTIHDSLSNEAFETLMAGDKDRHDEMLVAAAKELAPRVDLILFAQASMTRLAPRVEAETGLTVLTSPRLAIEYTKRVLDGLPQLGG